MNHPKNVQIRLGDQQSLDLVLVEGGSFLMGNEKSEHDDERPICEVTVSSFYMGKYQVTQAQWQEIMGSNPSRFNGENRPIERVSWLEVQEFLNKLNGKMGKHLRLPTEAEWEYAARGGRYSESYLFAGSDKLKQVGLYYENPNNMTCEVGQFLANELGLYDMSGNIREWCEDVWHENYAGAPSDGTAWTVASTGGSRRVVRGGGFLYGMEGCTCTCRDWYGPADRQDSIGFRLAMPI